MSKKYIMISMDDNKAEELSKILGNKTCKKILEHLSEVKDASEKDMSDALEIPINTLEYNLNKLIKVGLVEKTKNFFWSKKGKKIPMYRISNKQILISPKSKTTSKIASIAPAAIISIAGAFIIKQLTSVKVGVETQSAKIMEATAPVATGASDVSREIAPTMVSKIPELVPASSLWIWFLFGAGLAIFTYTLLNWRKL